MPSASRLRQRLDANVDMLLAIMYDQTIAFLAAAKVPVSPLSTGHVTLDLGVFPMDKLGDAEKRGVVAFKGHDGYAPMVAYLGQEGWCLACELREGRMHCQNEFP